MSNNDFVVHCACTICMCITNVHSLYTELGWLVKLLARRLDAN